MNKKAYFIFFLFLLFTFLSKSQDSLNRPFSLEACIDYALQHNIELQQYALLESKADLNSKNAKNDYLPAIEAGIKNNYNWGLFIDPSTNILTTQNTEIWSGGIGADWLVFNGGSNYYNYKQSKEYQNAARADLQIKKNEVTINVTAAYFQLLYYQEQLKLANLQKAQSENYYLLIKKNVESGVLHKRELLRLETQIAMNDVSITESQNSCQRFNLLLRQTMGYLGNESIELDTTKNYQLSETQFPKNDSINTNALRSLPELNRAKYLLNAKKYGIKAVSSLHYPSMSISAGVQTKSSSLILSPQRDQFKRNMSEYVTFNFRVPIFNRFQTVNSIAIARVELLIQEREVAKVNLQTDQRMQMVQLELATSNKKYWAFAKQLRMQEAQFTFDEKSYLNGIISYTDYNYSLNLLNQARIQLLQAQYDYLYKKWILDFYDKYYKLN